MQLYPTSLTTQLPLAQKEEYKAVRAIREDSRSVVNIHTKVYTTNFPDSSPPHPKSNLTTVRFELTSPKTRPDYVSGTSKAAEALRLSAEDNPVAVLCWSAQLMASCWRACFAEFRDGRATISCFSSSYASYGICDHLIVHFYLLALCHVCCSLSLSDWERRT